MDSKRQRKLQRQFALSRTWLHWHHNQTLCNQTVNWKGSDSKDRWVDNMNHRHNRQTLLTAGYDKDSITYTFNHAGFRDDEFDQRPSILLLGCSHVLGIGLAREHRWSDVLGTRLGMKIWNLGIDGAALDTCLRMLVTWLPRLNVKMVMISMPPATRAECPGVSVFPVPLGPWSMTDPEWTQNFYRVWCSQDDNMHMHEIKNILSARMICDMAGVSCEIFPAEKWVTIYPDEAPARDLQHPGIGANLRAANHFESIVKNTIDVTALS